MSGPNRQFTGSMRIQCGIWTGKPIDATTGPRDFLSVFRSRGVELSEVASAWTGDQYERLDPALTQLVQAWSEAPRSHTHKSFYLRDSASSQTSVLVSIDLMGRHPFDVVLITEEKYAADCPSRQERSKWLALDLFRLLAASYGRVAWRAQESPAPVSLAKGLPGLFWGNILGPEYVELMGRARLLEIGNRLGLPALDLAEDGVYLEIPHLSPCHGDTPHASHPDEIATEIGTHYFRGPVGRDANMLAKPKTAEEVPVFRFRKDRASRYEEWIRQGGITIEELVRTQLPGR